MQKTLFIKLSIIFGLGIILAIGLTIFSEVIYERQQYADTVVSEIAQQHVNPQEVITPFIAVPTTVTPACSTDAKDKDVKCASSYSTIQPIFATQTMADQDLSVSTDTYKRGIYRATSYEGALSFNQRYALGAGLKESTIDNNDTSASNLTANTVITDWSQAKIIIPVSDLRGVAVLPTVTIEGISIKATYPETPLLQGLSYVEVAIPLAIQTKLKSKLTADANLSIEYENTTTLSSSKDYTEIDNTEKDSTETDTAIKVIIELPLSGISALNTVPTGQNFEMTMRSNWHAPNFIGKALPNAKSLTNDGFNAQWQNQYLTVANNQYLSQCLMTPNNQCTIISQASLEVTPYAYTPEIARADHAAMESPSLSGVSLHSFGVSFAEPNDVYLQTERTMKYALLLIMVSFGTFFLFEIIKSSRIHPIQYLLVGCALLTFYVLLLPLAEQIVFWQAYAIAGTACVGLIGWYTYYVLGGVQRALMFTAILGGLYAAFYGILTIEDLNLLFGALFCFALLSCVMVMTRNIDWYKVA